MRGSPKETISIFDTRFLEKDLMVSNERILSAQHVEQSNIKWCPQYIILSLLFFFIRGEYDNVKA
jgi:hypothetical protein